MIFDDCDLEIHDEILEHCQGDETSVVIEILNGAGNTNLNKKNAILVIEHLTELFELKENQ